MKEIEQNNLENMDIKKLSIKTSLPMVISMISIALYGIVDTIFVSNMSENALTAISLAFPIQSIITAIALGIGIGCNTLIAKTLGEKNEEKVQKIIINGIILTFMSWIVIILITQLGIKHFFRLFTKDLNIIDLGISYLYITSMFSFGTLYQILFEKILEAYGKTKYSMFIQLVGTIINLILDPILIYGLFGINALGIKGAAIATVIGQIIGMLFGMYLVIKQKIIKKIDKIKLDKEITKEIYRVGLPTTILESLSAFITLLLNKVLIDFSDLAVAVWGIYVKIQKFIFIIVYGLNYGMIPIIAYNYGAKKIDRVIETIKYFIKLVIVVTIIGTLIFWLLPKQMIQAFGVSEEVIKLGIPAFRILSIGFVFAGISMVLTAIFQSFGNGTYSLIVNLSRKIIFILPIIYLFKNIFGISIIWWAFTIAELLTMFVAICLFNKIYRSVIKKVNDL